jgi:hypothetical protein
MCALDDGEVERQVVSLEPPAPRRARGRLAENRDVVKRGIAAPRRRVVLDLLEDVIERPDRLGPSPDRNNASARSRCAADMALSGSPWRAIGTKYQVSRSVEESG